MRSAVILGSAGQLGSELRRLLPQAVACDRRQVDLTQPDTVRRLLQDLRPEFVFNAAAYNAVDRAESERSAAFAVNADAVRDLAISCRDCNCRLVHFSTNYVFGQDERRQTPYREVDETGPISVYGASKQLGETHLQSVGPRHLIIRTCGLFGRGSPDDHSTSFVVKLLERARRGDPLRVVSDQTCTPTASADLAEATLRLCAAGVEGLIHYTSAGACTWHEFACAVLRGAGCTAQVQAISSAELDAPARRPRYSVLDGTAYDRLGFPPRPSWQQALEAHWLS